MNDSLPLDWSPGSENVIGGPVSADQVAANLTAMAARDTEWRASYDAAPVGGYTADGRECRLCKSPIHGEETVWTDLCRYTGAPGVAGQVFVEAPDVLYVSTRIHPWQWADGTDCASSRLGEFPRIDKETGEQIIAWVVKRLGPKTITCVRSVRRMS